MSYLLSVGQIINHREKVAISLYERPRRLKCHPLWIASSIHTQAANIARLYN